MTRMTREFSLVLLGSSLLAGSSVFVGEDLEHKANEEVQQQLAGRNGQVTHHSRTHFLPILFHSSRSTGFSRGPSSVSRVSTSVSRGGFGGTGRGVSAVS